MNSETNYDVAISFAEEDILLAEDIVRHLKTRGVKTFFYKDEEAESLGEELLPYLFDIYQSRAKYCIVLISEHYLAKPWTKYELRAIQTRVLEDPNVYLLPIR